MQLSRNTVKSNAVNLLALGPVGTLAGALAGGLTPSWNTEDVAAMGNDKAYGSKVLIPGYQPYKNMKLLGYQLALQRRVEEAAKYEAKHKESKQQKSAVLYKQAKLQAHCKGSTNMKYTDIQRLRKEAKMLTADLGDGYKYRYDDRNAADRDFVSKVQEKVKPMGVGAVLLDSTPASLVAAAIGGLGSMALSNGNPFAGAAGAAASGLGTLALNAFSNYGKRKMSVQDAIQEAQQEA
jgi:hypothetical protein